jgi:hypothetical protein
VSTPPNINDLLGGENRGAFYDFWTALPAVVVDYDQDTQTVTAQPLLRQRRVEEDGTLSSIRMATCTFVPVVFHGPITFPIESGDHVLLVFVSGDIDRWVSTGRESVPVSFRRNDLTDAFAIPTLRCPKKITDPASTVATVITHDDIRLGSKSADDHAIKGETYRNAEDTLLTALGVFATAVGNAVPALAGAATTLNTAITNFQAAATSYLADKVRIE